MFSPSMGWIDAVRDLNLTAFNGHNNRNQTIFPAFFPAFRVKGSHHQHDPEQHALALDSLGGNQFSPEITLNHTDEIMVATAIMIWSKL
jgi:hypothetical protein